MFQWKDIKNIYFERKLVITINSKIYIKICFVYALNSFIQKHNSENAKFQRLRLDFGSRKLQGLEIVNEYEVNGTSLKDDMS